MRFSDSGRRLAPSRRWHRLLALLILAIAGECGHCRRHAAAGNVAEAAQQTARPNVVVIMADDLGYGDLGCYGATKISTPHCNRLAKEGRRFTDAHTPSGVCSP